MEHNTIAASLETIKPKDKEPRNRSVLDSWIAHIEADIDTGRSGRLIWLIGGSGRFTGLTLRAESFFATLKNEMYYRASFATRAHKQGWP